METAWWMDKGRGEHRENVRTVDRLLQGMAASAATAQPDGTAAQLLKAWVRLQESMALGEEPVCVACPHCGVAGVQGALRCSGCWSLLGMNGSTVVGGKASARGVA